MAHARQAEMRLASAPLEVLGIKGDESIQLHAIKSIHPAVDDDNVRQPALRASCHVGKRLILALTPFADSDIIEIRTIALDSDERDMAPQQILFPAPLLPDIHLVSDSEQGVVLLQACSATGYLYRIRIILASLSNVEDIPASWTIEQKLNAVSSDVQAVLRDKNLQTVHCSSDGQVILISCSDGRIIKLVWEQFGSSGAWKEAILRPSSFLGRFFARGGSSSAAASQILSMQTFARSRQASETLAFVISQDRRLRIWDIGNETCVRTIDLPSTLNRSLSSDTQLTIAAQEEQDQQAHTYDRPAFVRVVSTQHVDASSPYAIYLVIALPPSPSSGPFLICYGIQFEAASSSSGRQFAGSIGDIDLLWEKAFDRQYSAFNVELRDVLVTPRPTRWDVWCVWDAEGKTAIQSLVVKSTPDANYDDDARWRSIDLPVSHNALYGQALERDLDMVLHADNLGFFFLDRITEADRFTLSALDKAVRAYKEGLLARGEDPVSLPPPGSLNANIREQIVALVGCTVHLQRDENTGADLHEQHLASLKREWAIFLALLAQADADDRWPIGFVLHSPEEKNSKPFIVSRGWLSLPVQADQSSKLLDRGTNILRGQGDQEEQLESPQQTAASILAFGMRLRACISPALIREFEATLLNVLASQPSRAIEDEAEELWSSMLQDELTEDEDALAEHFSLLGNDIASTLDTLLSCVSGAETIDGRHEKSERWTELSAALVSDVTTQTISDRLQICKIAITTIAAITSGYFELDTDNSETGSLLDTLRQFVFYFQKLFSLDLMSHYDGIAEVKISERESADSTEEGASDPDLVAKRIGNLRVNSASYDRERALPTNAAANVMHKAALMGIYRTHSSSGDLSTQVASKAFAGLQMLLHGADTGQTQSADLSSQLVLLANAALRSGHPTAVVAFVGVFPRSAAGDYLVARSLLSLDEHDTSANLFESVLAAFEHWSEERTTLGSGLALILPSNVVDSDEASTAAFQFCRLLVSYFKRAMDLQNVVRFCIAALNHANATSDHGESLQTRDLHLSLFRCCVDLESYDDAYEHLLTIPFDDLQRESLRTFISIMCESGRVQQLLAYNFAGLQSEVERTLSFKARNSDPLSEDGENYYNVLYAFHTRRGDLKSAGATMWQMGARINEAYRRRLAQVRRSNVGAVDVRAAEADLQRDAIVEARCYLASVNALSLIDGKDAWFAHETSGNAEDYDVSSASHLTTFLPPSAFQQRPREIRIVSLNDVRRRYQLLLAQLELISLYPDEVSAILSSSFGEGANAVLLAVRNQDYELAFSLAHTNQIDRTEAYVSLTDKCLELTRWEEIRRESSKLTDGLDEHPLMKALYDDQSTMAAAEQAIFDQTDTSSLRDQPAMPSARFLDRSDRCVTWTGSVAERAWRYLRLWLSFEKDEGGTGEGYRVAVLARILDRRLWRMTPRWLLRSLRDDGDAEALIKALMEHDLLVPALNEAVQLVELSTAQTGSTIKRRRIGTSIAQKTYLPYLLFDVLLKRSEDAVGSAPSDGPSSNNFAEQRKAANALREAVEKHKDRLRSLEKEARRNMADDQQRARRLGDAQKQQQQFNSADVEMMNE